jgi:hypothetical protein
MTDGLGAYRKPALILTHPARAAELVCHDEQMVIWSGDVVGMLSMGGWLREELSYGDGIELHEAITRELRSIVAQAFTHPEATGR